MEKNKCFKFNIKTSIVCFMIVFLLLVTFSDFGYLKAFGESSGYRFHLVLNDDSSEADIIGDSTAIKKGVEIHQITNPDGDPMDLQNVKYHITENKSYIFQVKYTSETREHTEEIQVDADTLLTPETNKVNEKKEPSDIQEKTLDSEVNGLVETNKPGISPSLGKKTVGQLLKAKSLEYEAAPFEIPMYIEGEEASQGNYKFSGGIIENIPNQTFDGKPYKFLNAEIIMNDGAGNQSYAINYYDKVGGDIYYSLLSDSAVSPDFEIASKAPPGSTVRFIYVLDTKEYPVTILGLNETEGFDLKFVDGIKKNDEGVITARESAQVKIVLNYPAGYYAQNAPAGKKNVGITFSNPSLQVAREDDYKNRRIIYTFTYPAESLTLTVIGDEEKDTLIYGLYDSTSNFQPSEYYHNWWRKTDTTGNYTKGDPFFGTDLDYERNEIGDLTNFGKMRVLGGTSKQIKSEGATGTINVASGTFNSEQNLDFEYSIFRYKTSREPYFFWPAPILNVCYFPNGADVETATPTSEAFQLWSPDWLYNPDTATSPSFSYTQTLSNGASITVSVKKYVNVNTGTSVPNLRLDVPDYQVHVKIENMKNSFYLKTQGSGSPQGPHYFRSLDNISLENINDELDSYFFEDYGNEEGGNPDKNGIRTIDKMPIKFGGIFLDKRGVYNKNISIGGVPWAKDDDVFFRFGITPKWGYTIPLLESYQGQSTTPIMLNKPIEIEKKETENKGGEALASLDLGKYSWFHGDMNRTDVSPFQYAIFMPVNSLTARHDLRAIDVIPEKITINITNNDADTTDPIHPNPYTDRTDLDLLEHDSITFNADYIPPKKDGYVFAGFSVTVTAPDNILLPKDYEVEITKDLDKKVFFKPGDNVSVSNFFRRDSKVLLDTWNEKGAFNEIEQNRLNFIMFSQNMKVQINPKYRLASSEEGVSITGKVNKYLQDVNNENLDYSNQTVDSKDIEVISGASVIFTKFAPTFVNPADGYTYYFNKDRTETKGQISIDGEEIASVKYDRGLNVQYRDTENSFNGNAITDENVYKTYAGSNQVFIKFPDATQSPLGKVLDYWTVEELNDAGQWVPKQGLEIKQEQTKTETTYDFSSGINGNNKSIRLTAVWKDISPDSYISIPKNILLTEKGTNLLPENEYAGTKVTITYQSVNGNDKSVYVDVLKSFDLSPVDDQTKKIKVSSYDTNGNLLSINGINDKYARIGAFGSTETSKDIWFNTITQNDNKIYKALFGISSDSSQAGEGVLFYISPVVK